MWTPHQQTYKMVLDKERRTGLVTRPQNFKWLDGSGLPRVELGEESQKKKKKLKSWGYKGRQQSVWPGKNQGEWTCGVGSVEDGIEANQRRRSLASIGISE